MNRIFHFIIIIDDFETTVHNKASSIKKCSALKHLYFRIRSWMLFQPFVDMNDFIFPTPGSLFAKFNSGMFQIIIIESPGFRSPFDYSHE